MTFRRTLPPLAVSAMLVLGLAACAERDYCAESPLCENNRAINCEPSCQVGPCSNGARFKDCGDQATCELQPGDLSSTRFFRSRAVCVVRATDTCDPALAPPPTCDGLGNITGCSAYRHVIVAACSQAGLFFQSSACCTQPFDGGTPDAGAPDGGSHDGGVSDGGRGGSDGGS